MNESFAPMTEPPTELPLVEPAPLRADQLAKESANAVAESEGLGHFLRQCIEFIKLVIEFLLGALINLLGTIAAKIGIVLMESKLQGNPAYTQLSAVAVKDLMDLDVAIGEVGPPGGSAQRTAVVKSIGEAILKGMFPQTGDGAVSSLQPSSEQAERYLTMVTRLAFEGWMLSWVSEIVGVGMIKNFGELDKKLSETLGLGRLSRRVLAAPLSILVETPFTWKLNKLYRPTLLGAVDAIKQFLRGRYTRERLFNELALAGYKNEDIEALIATHQQFFSPAELLFLNEMEAWDDQACVQHLRDQGYSESMAKEAMALAKHQKIDAYRRQMAGVAGAAFESQDIGEAQFRQVLSTLNLPDYETEYLFKVWGLRREFRVRYLTISDVQDAVKRGILTLNDFRAWCMREGYSLQDETTLELLLLSEIKDKQTADDAKKAAAHEKAAAAAAKAAAQQQRQQQVAGELAARAISLSQIEALVRRGLRTIEQYRDFLRKAGYAAQDVADLAELLQGKIDDANAQQQRHDELAAEATKRKISLADLERAVRLGLMSVDEYRSQLAAAGFGDEDRNLLAQILQRQLDQVAEAEAQRKAAQDRLAERHIALADLERAVRLGIRSVDSYRAYLVTQGFSADDADLMADLVRQDIAQDQAARDRRAEIEAKLKKKKVSLSEFEQAVRAGVRSMADYRAMLLAEGYTEQDVDLLARLLQLQVDADKEAADRRQAAEALLAQHNISLADMERACKLGVVTVPDYKAMLKREGFSDDDQGILVNSLLAQLAQVRDAEAKRAAAEKKAAAKKISLSDLARAVRLGLRAAVEYQAVLQELAYSPEDQATLMGLLQLQMAQDQAARAKREQVASQVQTRGLSLSEWEHSVLAGIRSVSEYQAWLSAQGYPPEDVATLAALLQLQLAEQAARQQGKPA